MFKVFIYSDGTSRCKQLRVRVHNALWMLGIRNFQIEVENDERKYPAFVTETPTIVIDDNVVCCGTLPELVEIQRMLAPYAFRMKNRYAA